MNTKRLILSSFLVLSCVPSSFICAMDRFKAAASAAASAAADAARHLAGTKRGIADRSPSAPPPVQRAFVFEAPGLSPAQLRAAMPEHAAKRARRSLEQQLADAREDYRLATVDFTAAGDDREKRHAVAARVRAALDKVERLEAEVRERAHAAGDVDVGGRAPAAGVDLDCEDHTTAFHPGRLGNGGRCQGTYADGRRCVNKGKCVVDGYCGRHRDRRPAA